MPGWTVRTIVAQGSSEGLGRIETGFVEASLQYGMQGIVGELCGARQAYAQGRSNST